jgi:hypothetical protein
MGLGRAKRRTCGGVSLLLALKPCELGEITYVLKMVSHDEANPAGRMIELKQTRSTEIWPHAEKCTRNFVGVIKWPGLSSHHWFVRIIQMVEAYDLALQAMAHYFAVHAHHAVRNPSTQRRGQFHMFVDVIGATSTAFSKSADNP